jgi:hypothetical protein
MYIKINTRDTWGWKGSGVEKSISQKLATSVFSDAYV